METKPKDLGLSIEKIDTHQVQLTKSLLNPGDQVLVKILVIDNDETLNITMRIAGISEPRILSVLEEQSSSEQKSIKLRSATIFIILSLFVLLIAFIIFWTSKVGIRWRHKHLNLKPASYYYALAQDNMMDEKNQPQNMKWALSNLSKAFSWDDAYVQKAQNDPWFAKLRKYEPFIVLIEKYNLPKS